MTHTNLSSCVVHGSLYYLSIPHKGHCHQWMRTRLLQGMCRGTNHFTITKMPKLWSTVCEKRHDFNSFVIRAINPTAHTILLNSKTLQVLRIHGLYQCPTSTTPLHYSWLLSISVVVHILRHISLVHFSYPIHCFNPLFFDAFPIA